MVRMENALVIWIHDCRAKNISLDANIIRSKAKSLFDAMVPEGGDDGNVPDEEEDNGDDDDEDDPLSGTSSQTSPRRPRTTFVASKGWFDKFKRRVGLKSVSLYGEAASADEAAARHYVEDVFPEIIEENGNVPEQVFNIMKVFYIMARLVPRACKNPLYSQSHNELADKGHINSLG